MISLKNVALAALVTMCATFVLRTAGTLSPTLFTNLTMAWFATMVRLLAGTALVLFYVVFLRNYVRGERSPLREATLWAIVGTVVALLPTVKHLLHQSHVYPVESLIWSDHLEALAPLLGSIAMLGFFIVLRRELDEGLRRDLDGGLRWDLDGGLRRDLDGGLRWDLDGGLRLELDGDLRRDPSGDVHPGAGAADREQHGPRLARATTLAAVGSGVFVLLNSIVLVNYFASGELRWLAVSTRPIALLSYLAVMVAFAALASFFFVLYREAANQRG